MGIKINGEPVQLAQGQVQRSDGSFEFEIDGTESVALVFTEKDETAPAGRYRFMVSGDAFTVERAKQSDLSEYDVAFKVTSAGPIVILEGVEINLAEQALEVQQLIDKVQALVGFIPPVGANSRL